MKSLTDNQNAKVLIMLQHVMGIMAQKYREEGLNICSYHTVEDGFDVEYVIHQEQDNWIVKMKLTFKGKLIGEYTGAISDLDHRHINLHASSLIRAWGFELGRVWKFNNLAVMKIFKAIEFGMHTVVATDHGKWNDELKGFNEREDDLKVVVCVERQHTQFKVTLSVPDIEVPKVEGAIGIGAAVSATVVMALASTLIGLLETNLRSHHG